MTHQMATVQTSDNVSIFISEKSAKLSHILNAMMDDLENVSTIPLTQVDSNTFLKIKDYCDTHSKTDLTASQLKAFDAALVDIDDEELYPLVNAAHFLGVAGLVSAGCHHIARSLDKSKSLEEIREILGITSEPIVPERKSVFQLGRVVEV